MTKKEFNQKLDALTLLQSEAEILTSKIDDIKNEIKIALAENDNEITSTRYSAKLTEVITMTPLPTAIEFLKKKKLGVYIKEAPDADALKKDIKKGLINATFVKSLFKSTLSKRLNINKL